MKDIQLSIQDFLKFVISEYNKFTKENPNDNNFLSNNNIDNGKLNTINEKKIKLNKYSFFDIINRYLDSKEYSYRKRATFFKIFFSVRYIKAFNKLQRIQKQKENDDYFNNKSGYFFYKFLYKIKENDKEKSIKKTFKKYNNDSNFVYKDYPYIYLPIWHKDENYLSLKSLIEKNIDILNEKYKKFIEKKLKFLEFNDDHFLFMVRNHIFKFNGKLIKESLLPKSDYNYFNSRYIFDFFPNIPTEIYDENESLTYERFNVIYYSKSLFSDCTYKICLKYNNTYLIKQGKFKKICYMDNSENFVIDIGYNKITEFKLNQFEINNIYSIIENLKYFITNYSSITILKLPMENIEKKLVIFDFSPKFLSFYKIKTITKSASNYLSDMSNYLNIKFSHNEMWILDEKGFNEKEYNIDNNMIYFSKIFNLNFNCFFFEIFYILKFVDLMKSDIFRNIIKFRLNFNFASISTNLPNFDKHILKIYTSFPTESWENLTLEIQIKYIKILEFFIELVINNEQDLMNSPIKLNYFYNMEKLKTSLIVFKKKLGINSILNQEPTDKLEISYDNHGFILFFREIIEYSINNVMHSPKMIIKNYFINFYKNIKYYIFQKFKNIYGHGMTKESLIEIFKLVKKTYNIAFNIFFLYLGIVSVFNFNAVFISNIETFSPISLIESKTLYAGLTIKSIIDQLYYLKTMCGIPDKFDYGDIVYNGNLFYVKKEELEKIPINELI